MFVTCTDLGGSLGFSADLVSDFDFLMLCLGARTGALGLRTESPQSVSELTTSSGAGLRTLGSLVYITIISHPESGEDMRLLL